MEVPRLVLDRAERIPHEYPSPLPAIAESSTRISTKTLSSSASARYMPRPLRMSQPHLYTLEAAGLDGDIGLPRVQSARDVSLSGTRTSKLQRTTAAAAAPDMQVAAAVQAMLLENSEYAGHEYAIAVVREAALRAKLRTLILSTVETLCLQDLPQTAAIAATTATADGSSAIDGLLQEHAEDYMRGFLRKRRGLSCGSPERSGSPESPTFRTLKRIPTADTSMKHIPTSGSDATGAMAQPVIRYSPDAFVVTGTVDRIPRAVLPNNTSLPVNNNTSHSRLRKSTSAAVLRKSRSNMIPLEKAVDMEDRAAWMLHPDALPATSTRTVRHVKSARVIMEPDAPNNTEYVHDRLGNTAESAYKSMSQMHKQLKRPASASSTRRRPGQATAAASQDHLLSCTGLMTPFVTDERLPVFGAENTVYQLDTLAASASDSRKDPSGHKTLLMLQSLRHTRREIINESRSKRLELSLSSKSMGITVSSSEAGQRSPTASPTFCTAGCDTPSTRSNKTLPGRDVDEATIQVYLRQKIDADSLHPVIASIFAADARRREDFVLGETLETLTPPNATMALQKRSASRSRASSARPRGRTDTATSDATAPSTATLPAVRTAGPPDLEKDWRAIRSPHTSQSITHQHIEAPSSLVVQPTQVDFDSVDGSQPTNTARKAFETAITTKKAAKIWQRLQHDYALAPKEESYMAGQRRLSSVTDSQSRKPASPGKARSPNSAAHVRSTNKEGEQRVASPQRMMSPTHWSSKNAPPEVPAAAAHAGGSSPDAKVLKDIIGTISPLSASYSSPERFTTPEPARGVIKSSSRSTADSSTVDWRDLLGGGMGTARTDDDTVDTSRSFSVPPLHPLLAAKLNNKHLPGGESNADAPAPAPPQTAASASIKPDGTSDVAVIALGAVRPDVTADNPVLKRTGNEFLDQVLFGSYFDDHDDGEGDDADEDDFDHELATASKRSLDIKTDGSGGSAGNVGNAAGAAALTKKLRIRSAKRKLRRASGKLHVALSISSRSLHGEPTFRAESGRRDSAAMSQLADALRVIRAIKLFQRYVRGRLHR